MTRKEQLKKRLAEEKLTFELLVCEQIRGTTLTYEQIGTRFGVKAREVAEIASKYAANRKRGKGSVAFKRRAYSRDPVPLSTTGPDRTASSSMAWKAEPRPT